MKEKNLTLINKHILLGITGSIAAYKSPDLVRRLREAGAEVQVVMTQAAQEFITPLTLQAVSAHRVHTDLLSPESEAAMGHIELARWADLILVAPASANFIARLAHGYANDLLTTLCLATTAAIAIAPAMNQQMWENKIVQLNLEKIASQQKIHLFGPGTGSQACGEFGEGRMLEPTELVEMTGQLFQTGSLSGKRVLITAGPTQEAIDPVRYLTNRSSGKMGYALAQAAAEAGAIVTLISGPTHLPCPPNVRCISVITAQEMYDHVMAEAENCDIFIANAAVADYRAANIASQKIKKTDKSSLSLTLERNPDILSTVGTLSHPPFTVGFAAETENLLEHAKEKLKNKKVDMIIGNTVGTQQGFEQDENSVIVLTRKDTQEFPRMNKAQLARELISIIARFSSNH